MAVVFKVGNEDFTDIISYEGYSFTEEDLHADGSGRNPITGLMEFVVVAQKRYVDITVTNMTPPKRIKALMDAVKKNGRVNQFTAYNPISNSVDTFTGYVNTRKVDLFNRYTKNGQDISNIKSFTMHIVEM